MDKNYLEKCYIINHKQSDKKMNYECPRCCYSTDKQPSMKRHLRKKTLCKLIKHDLTPLEYEDSILTNDNSKIFDDLVECRMELETLKKENEELIAKADHKTNGYVININVDKPDDYTPVSNEERLKKILKSLPEIIQQFEIGPDGNPQHIKI